MTNDNINSILGIAQVVSDDDAIRQAHNRLAMDGMAAEDIIANDKAPQSFDDDANHDGGGELIQSVSSFSSLLLAGAWLAFVFGSFAALYCHFYEDSGYWGRSYPYRYYTTYVVAPAIGVFFWSLVFHALVDSQVKIAQMLRKLKGTGNHSSTSMSNVSSNLPLFGKLCKFVAFVEVLVVVWCGYISFSSKELPVLLVLILLALLLLGAYTVWKCGDVCLLQKWIESASEVKPCDRLQEGLTELRTLVGKAREYETEKHVPDMMALAQKHQKAMAEALAKGNFDEAANEGGKVKETYEKAIATSSKAQEAALLEDMMRNLSLSIQMLTIPEKKFSIGKYLVTQQLWECVMGTNPSQVKGAELPVTNVAYVDCRKFLERLNALPEVITSGLPYRLPTKEEWQYACSANANGDYCKLEDGTEISKTTLEDVAWFDGNSDGRPHPVGQKKPNAFGLYDMLGNVWEWTSTHDHHYVVYCGGSFENSANACKVSNYNNAYPDGIYNSLGFRLARDIA